MIDPLGQFSDPSSCGGLQDAIFLEVKSCPIRANPVLQASKAPVSLCFSIEIVYNGIENEIEWS